MQVLRGKVNNLIARSEDGQDTSLLNLLPELGKDT